MRIFLGLECAIHALPAYQVLEKFLKNHVEKNTIPAQFKHPDDLHITLHFLGEIDESRLGELDFIETAAKKFGKQTMSVTGFGSFPSWEKSRGLWLDIQKNKALETLHLDLKENLLAKNFKLEERRYVPHITMVRFKNPIAIQLNVDKDVKKASSFNFEVGKVNIYSSEKTAEGTRYRVLTP